MRGFRVVEVVPVRWGDMDAFGHVNNARYFTYCESARISWFHAIELDRFRAEESHGPALVSAHLDFQRQVHHPATLEVGCRATRVGGKSFHLEYSIWRQENDEVVAAGTSAVAWVDYARGRAIALPEELKERIRGFDRLGE